MKDHFSGGTTVAAGWESPAQAPSSPLAAQAPSGGMAASKPSAGIPEISDDVMDADFAKALSSING
jgi:hypothetical protein